MANDPEPRDTLVRYSPGERTNHWIVAIAFVLAALSGLAMFHPAIPPALLTETGGGSAWRAFFGELRRLGYVEGQSLIIERYWAEGRHDRYADDH